MEVLHPDGCGFLFIFSTASTIFQMRLWQHSSIFTRTILPISWETFSCFLPLCSCEEILFLLYSLPACSPPNPPTATTITTPPLSWSHAKNPTIAAAPWTHTACVDDALTSAWRGVLFVEKKTHQHQHRRQNGIQLRWGEKATLQWEKWAFKSRFGACWAT